MTAPAELQRSFSRRDFLRGGAVALGGLALAGPLQLLLARQARASFSDSPVASPYGPVRPRRDLATGLRLLKLPRGFHYRSFGWTGDSMDDGMPTPPAHDGMAVVSSNGRSITLVRNHEVAFGPLIGGDASPSIYDRLFVPPVLLPPDGANLGGGTTTLRFRGRKWRGARGSLGGTVANCAGGPTPWGSWLSCEETIADASVLGGEKHGYVFEVPADAAATANPIREMGHFSHEAAAVDPRSGIVYLTEDDGPQSGFYRFLPDDTSPRVGALENGGTLQMLKVLGVEMADLGAPLQGESFRVEWVTIPEPDRLPPPSQTQDGLIYDGPSAPYTQGRNAGAARFVRGEGCWYDGTRGAVFFVDTTGGGAGQGVVWRYDPPADELRGNGRLTAVLVSRAPAALDRPDNVTVSPRGGLLVCEDGAPDDGLRLMGVLDDGCSYTFAVNNVLLEDPVPGKPAIAPGDYRGSEWAGATFDPRGRVLFVNVQTPGISFAIWGPWPRGNL